nr:hypothetical protein [Microbacterium hydrocarbonoxydans]
MMPSRLRHATALLTVVGASIALAGCSLLGIPQNLTADDLAEMSSAVTAAQTQLDATLTAESKTCEGLCQHVALNLVPKNDEYGPVDIALAIREADTLLDSRDITSFDVCFHSTSWDESAAEELGMKLAEIDGLTYLADPSKPGTFRPMYDCGSFAVIDARKLLDAYLAEQGVGD